MITNRHQHPLRAKSYKTMITSNVTVHISFLKESASPDDSESRFIDGQSYMAESVDSGARVPIKTMTDTERSQFIQSPSQDTQRTTHSLPHL